MQAINKVKLGEICRFEKGASPTMKTPPGKYPLVVTAEYRRTSADYQFDEPAICIPLISSTGHGDAALHRLHYQDGKFALANLLVALMPKHPGECNAKYLYHLLSTQKDSLFVPLMQGTANVSLKMSDIAEVSIDLPKIERQLQIVKYIEALLDQLDAARTLREQKNLEIDHMLLGAFSKIVKNSERRPMSEIAPLVRRPIEVEPLGFYPELGIRSFGKGTFHKPVLTGTQIGDKRIFSIEPGDLLFSNVFAWEGAIAVARHEDVGRVGSHRFITCVPKPGLVTSHLLCYYFLTEEGLRLFQSASPGGALRNRTLGLAALSTIEVPTPNIADQEWFDTLQSRVADLDAIQRAMLHKLDALRPSVLARAFAEEL